MRLYLILVSQYQTQTNEMKKTELIKRLIEAGNITFEEALLLMDLTPDGKPIIQPVITRTFFDPNFTDPTKHKITCGGESQTEK